MVTTVRLLRGVAAALAGVTVLVAGGALPTAAAQDVIKIAVGAPLTGPLAKQGQEVANSVKLAVEQWNAKGGVLGKQIEVLEADDQGNPQIGVSAAEKVAADDAVLAAVCGTGCSTTRTPAVRSTTPRWTGWPSACGAARRATAARSGSASKPACRWPTCGRV
jgi:hypothetical protein